MRSTTRRSAVVLIVAVLVIVAVALVIVRGGDSAAIQTQPVVAKKVDEKAARKQQAQQARMKEQSFVVSVYQRETWDCQKQLGATPTRGTSAWGMPRSIRIRDKIIKFWRQQTTLCTAAIERLTIPSTRDWVTAVRLVQRINPGTDRWLLSCSSGEGGHGGFVMNHQGSGAGGWMQFMSSTFYAHFRQAFADARARGFVIDRIHESWYDPLGQALTASYMRSHGMSSHWDPGIDPLCR